MRYTAPDKDTGRCLKKINQQFPQKGHHHHRQTDLFCTTGVLRSQPSPVPEAGDRSSRLHNLPDPYVMHRSLLKCDPVA